jgi:hypothetical protein
MAIDRRVLAAAAALALSGAVLVGCGAGGTAPAGSAPVTTSNAPAPENNPAGDIPDNQAYVPYSTPGGQFTVSVPEGWGRTTDATATVFSDKLNAVRIETRDSAVAPTVDSAKAGELPAIASATAGYRPGGVSLVDRKAGPAVLITYQATAAPNPVTGKAGTDAVERYEFWRNGRELILTLSGPVGADNVDPWRTITDSVQWQ